MAGDVVKLRELSHTLASRALPAAVMDRMPLSVSGALVVEPFSPEYETAGTRLNLPLVSAKVSRPIASADLSAALTVAERACLPAGPAAALKAAARMRVTTRQRATDETDEALMLVVYGEKLGRYPADAVALACEAWLDASPFWPSVSEILHACERAMQPRRELVLALTLKLREMGNA